MNSLRLLNPFSVDLLTKVFASTGKGRWFPQPIDEMSRHRTREPTYGIHRRTRLLCVDDSTTSKEANMSGKLAYCIWTFKPGYEKRHMPKAKLGDRVLVAVKGEIKKAVVVGERQHYFMRKHGIPSTDTNNIVLMNNEGNPMGKRILAPVPAYLMRLQHRTYINKITSVAKKYF